MTLVAIDRARPQCAVLSQWDLGWLGHGLAHAWLSSSRCERVLLGVVQGEVERRRSCASRRLLATPSTGAVADQRHPLLGHPAVRAQRHFERREVVPAGARCRCTVLRSLTHDDVADAVGRQLEALGGLGARQHRLHARAAARDALDRTARGRRSSGA